MLLRQRLMETSNRLYPDFDVIISMEYKYHVGKKRRRIKKTPTLFFLNSSGLVDTKPTNKVIEISNIYIYSIRNKRQVNYNCDNIKTQKEIFEMILFGCDSLLPVNVITDDKITAVLLNYIFKVEYLYKFNRGFHTDCKINQKRVAKVKIWKVSWNEKIPYNSNDDKTLYHYNNHFKLHHAFYMKYPTNKTRFKITRHHAFLCV